MQLNMQKLESWILFLICVFGQLNPSSGDPEKAMDHKGQYHFIFFIPQNIISCQVPYFIHRIYCIQQEIPVPDAPAPWWPEES